MDSLFIKSRKARKLNPKVAPNAPSGEDPEIDGSSDVELPFRVFIREVERAMLAGEPLSSGVLGTLVDMLRKNDDKELADSETCWKSW
jgi:hypothetical protein